MGHQKTLIVKFLGYELDRLSGKLHQKPIQFLRVPSSADFDFKIYGSLAKHT